jgi:predicted CoA-binding protein
MDQKIQDFVSSKRIAVAGVSRTPQKMGNGIYTELKQRGYEVFGVNPNLETIDGDKCYPSLAELAGKVDAVVVSVPPQQAALVLRDAAAAGIKKVWLQQGSQSLETSKVAKEAGLTPVEGKCILMYAGEVKSIHAFHRFFAKLFGQY